MPEVKEIWVLVDIIDDVPRYQISNKGNIKSLIGKEKILKPTKDNKGYLHIKLSIKPKEKGVYRRKDFRIHRLVAMYFCDNYAEEKEIHHINLNRQDNQYTNLICLTKKEHLEIHKNLNNDKRGV